MNCSKRGGEYMSRTIMLSAAAIVVFLFYTLVTSVDLSMVGNSQPNQSIAKRYMRGEVEGDHLNEHIRSRQLQEKECFIGHSAKLDLTMCTTAKGLARSDIDWSSITAPQLKAALVNNSAIGYPTSDSIEVVVLGTEGPGPCKLSGAVQWYIQVSYNHKIETDGKIVYAPEVASAYLDGIVGYRADSTFIQNVLAEIGMAKHISRRDIGRELELPLSIHNGAEVSIEASGWSVIFDESTPTNDPGTEETSFVNGLSINLGEKDEWWPPWAWVIFLIAALLCFIPTCIIIIRSPNWIFSRRRASQGTKSLEGNSNSLRMVDEGLHKIRGPEWGITELDFTSSGSVYGDPDGNWNALNESLRRNAGAEQLSPDIVREIAAEHYVPPRTDPMDMAWEAELIKGREWNATGPRVNRIGSFSSLHDLPKFDMGASQDGMNHHNNNIWE